MSDTHGSAGPADIRVLLVDDSQTVRRTVAAALAVAGWTVECVADGMQALAAIWAHVPDIVLLDAGLPGLDGYQTCALIRAHARPGHIRLIMLSANDDVFARARARIVGAQAHVSKSAAGEVLLDTVRRQLNAV